MKEIKTIEEFDEATQKGKVLVDFYAEWCAPCKMIAPELEKINNTNDGFEIVKADVTELQATSQKYGVSSVPTFILFEDGEKVDQFSGANLDVIKQKLGI